MTVLSEVGDKTFFTAAVPHPTSPPLAFHVFLVLLSPRVRPGIVKEAGMWL
uniref:Uncharacterized protein n=1 Tax=Triticum urartu TaxID=4572 RepID=A0A8R7UDC4_TRIUA